MKPTSLSMSPSKRPIMSPSSRIPIMSQSRLMSQSRRMSPSRHMNPSIRMSLSRRMSPSIRMSRLWFSLSTPTKSLSLNPKSLMLTNSQ